MEGFCFSGRLAAAVSFVIGANIRMVVSLAWLLSAKVGVGRKEVCGLNWGSEIEPPGYSQQCIDGLSKRVAN